MASQKHVDKKHKKRKKRDRSSTPPSGRAHPHPVAPMPFYPGYHPWMPWPGMYMPRPAFMPVPCHAHAVERSKEELRKERKEKRGEKTKREGRRDSRAKKSRRRRKASCSGSSSCSSSRTSRSAQRTKKVAHTEHNASRITNAKESLGSKLQEQKEPELSCRENPESWTCSTCDEHNKWERASCNNCYSSRPALSKAVGGSASKSDVAVVANCPQILANDEDADEDEEEEAYQQAVRAAFNRSMTSPHDRKLPMDSCKTSPRIILQKEGSSSVSTSRGQPPASASSASIETPQTSQLVQESLTVDPPTSASSVLGQKEEKVPTSPISSVSEEVQVVHEELESWLTSLDGGRGGMLQYLPALAKFGTNLKELAAVRERPPDSGQSILDVIRPTFWNAIGVSKQGHKLVIARGLAQLAEKF